MGPVEVRKVQRRKRFKKAKPLPFFSFQGEEGWMQEVSWWERMIAIKTDFPPEKSGVNLVSPFGTKCQEGI